MKATRIGRRMAGWATLGVAAALIVGLVGCATSNPSVAGAASPVCPHCQKATRATSVDSVSYTKYVCPGCRRELDTGTWAEAAELKAVHVCDMCKSVVAKCPMCAKAR